MAADAAGRIREMARAIGVATRAERARRLRRVVVPAVAVRAGGVLRVLVQPGQAALLMAADASGRCARLPVAVRLVAIGAALLQLTVRRAALGGVTRATRLRLFSAVRLVARRARGVLGDRAGVLLLMAARAWRGLGTAVRLVAATALGVPRVGALSFGRVALVASRQTCARLMR